MNLQEVRAVDWINLALSIEALLFFETSVNVHLTFMVITVHQSYQSLYYLTNAHNVKKSRVINPLEH